MHHFGTLIESSLRNMVEAELGPGAWDSIQRDAVIEQVNDPEITHEISQLHSWCKLATKRLRREQTAVMLDLGIRWWSTSKPSRSVKGTLNERRKSLLEQVRSDMDLLRSGLIVAPHIGLYPSYGFMLHHTRPIKRCRAFLFGVLRGAGKTHRLPIDIRLLEPYELNGHSDILAVEY